MVMYSEKVVEVL